MFSFIYLYDLVKHRSRQLEKEFSDLSKSEETHLFQKETRLCDKAVILLSSGHEIRRLALPVDSNLAVDVVADYFEYFMSFEFEKEWERSKCLRIARKVLNNHELHQTNLILLIHFFVSLLKISFLFFKKNTAQNYAIHEYWETADKIQDRLKEDYCQYFLLTLKCLKLIQRNY